MGIDYIEIEAVSPELENKVKQQMKFKTGKFIWQVKFTAPLNPDTVNNINLYVTSINLTPLKTSIRYNSVLEVIEIEPLEPYAQNESYILNITKKVQSQGGQSLKKDLQIQFKI